MSKRILTPALLRAGAQAWNDTRAAHPLAGINLYRAYLAGADLSAANLRGAKFVCANFSGANLSGANLEGVDFTQADLTGANLCGANLKGADFAQADLTGANLGGANLRNAYLILAYLQGANFIGADIKSAKFSEYRCCPPIGAFHGWKYVRKAYHPSIIHRSYRTMKKWAVIELEIPADAKRTSCLASRQCRASKVRVVSGSGYSPVMVGKKRIHYLQGLTIRADSWDSDIRTNYAHGIHFYMTKKEAEEDEKK